MMTIERAANGFIVRGRTSGSTPDVYKTTEELLAQVLQFAEGRASCFGGSLYGRVIIEREEPRAGTVNELSHHSVTPSASASVKEETPDSSPLSFRAQVIQAGWDGFQGFNESIEPHAVNGYLAAARTAIEIAQALIGRPKRISETSNWPYDELNSLLTALSPGDAE